MGLHPQKSRPTFCRGGFFYAAAPALHWIKENETPLNRTLGVAQGVGGALEIVAGGATLFTTGLTGVGAVGGGLLIASGVDNFMTGVQTAWDGKARHTMISDGIGSAAEWAGASPEMAEAIRSTSDIMTPGLATTLGRAGIRGGQQALGALALKPHDPFAPALAGGPQGATAASVFRQESAADSAGGVLAAAANAGEEAAEAAEGAAETPKEHARAAAKNYRGIKVDKEGQPYFEGTSYTYKTWAGKEAVTAIVTKGNRIGDRLSANEALKISEEEFDFLRKEGYHLHHRNDFDEKTKKCTVEYVQRDAHRATYPHQGAIKEYNDYIKRSKESEGK